MKFITQRIVITILILFFSTSSIYAQKNGNDIIEKFFTLYEKNPIEAVDYVFSTNKWMARNQDGVDNLKNQLKNSLDLIGTYRGYEIITSRNVGNSYKLISYMLKYDRQPLRFTFILYNPNSKWQVQNFKFDDNLGEEIEESAKLYFLNDNWKF